MSVKRVSLKDFAKELGKFNATSLQEQKAAVARGLARSIPDLVAASPVDTGLYAQSWDFKVDEESATIGNTAPHAAIIEYGARPFTPPIGPLLEWAKRRLTNATWVDKNTGESKKLRNTGQPESGYAPEVWALAKRVQKLISERGMIPRHILENETPAIIENIKQEFKNG